MNKILVTFLGVILCFCAFGQNNKVVLTLDQSMDIAADSSLQAFRTQNMYMANYWSFRSYKAARLPSMKLNMTPIQYNRDFTKRYDSSSNMDVYRQQQSLYTYGNLSITQNLDITGGTFFVDSELGYMRNFAENVYSQYSTVPIRVGYAQSLFGFNSIKWEKKIEPLRFEIAKKQYIYSKEEISESVIYTFFDLAMARMEHDMAKDNVASADTLYHIGQQRQEIASISQADLMTLKLDAVNAKNALKTSELSLKRAMFRFVTMLNLDKDCDVELLLPDNPSNLAVSVDEALLWTRENNPDLLSFQNEILEAEREVDRTKKQSNFDANFSVSVGFNQASNTFNNAYRNPLQQDVVRVGLSIPIVDWGVKRGRANMAKNNLNVAKISVQQKEQTLEQDIVMTVNDFNIQQDLIESAKEALNLSTMAYNSTKQRFIIGKADINSLTLSLSRQNSAQRNYIGSLRNYWLSYYRIRKLTLYDFNRKETLSVEYDKIFGL